MKKAIETTDRFYIFMEYCNGGDLKELMEAKNWDVHPSIIQRIMAQIIVGYNEAIINNVVHRDIKLQNIMIHFND